MNSFACGVGPMIVRFRRDALGAHRLELAYELFGIVAHEDQESSLFVDYMPEQCSDNLRRFSGLARHENHQTRKVDQTLIDVVSVIVRTIKPEKDLVED